MNEFPNIQVFEKAHVDAFANSGTGHAWKGARFYDALMHVIEKYTGAAEIDWDAEVLLDVCVSMCVSRCVCLSMCASMCASQRKQRCPERLCLSPCLSPSLPQLLYVCVSMCLCVNVFVCQCVCLSICVCQYVCQCVCLSMCVSRCVCQQQKSELNAFLLCCLTLLSVFISFAPS